MKVFLSFLLFVFCSLVEAKPRVVILTSLPETHLEERIKKLVDKKLDHDFYEVTLTHKATQVELYRALQSNPHALIWVSHGTAPMGVNGAGFVPLILDYNQQDVSALFQLLPSSVQFLSVTSCFARKALEAKNVNLDHVEGFFIPNKKVPAMMGLRRALRALNHTALDEHKVTNEISAPFKIEVTQMNASKPVQVLVNQRLVGMMFETGTYEFPVQSLGNVRLEMPKAESYEWSDFIIRLNQVELKVFTDKNGVPFGTHSRVFIK